MPIYLLALDPATGQGAMAAAACRTGAGIALDPIRRRAGATPSYAAGILVCPTAASAVIAIDVVKREFAWVYRYPREAAIAGGRSATCGRTGAEHRLVRVNDRWLDSRQSSATDTCFSRRPNRPNCIASICRPANRLEASAGRCVVRRGRGRGHVLLVGAESVQALRALTRAQRLAAGIGAAAAGALPPAGIFERRPILSAAHVRRDRGDRNRQRQADDVSVAEAGNGALGNLICYRGSILSQSALMLDKFEQLDVLQQRAETALAANPDDADGAARIGRVEAGGRRNAAKR